MKIAVCIKQIQYIYARTGRDPKTHFIAEEDRIRMINPYDELAVEEAIRIKERLGEGEVILITLGDLMAERALKRCLAMGADRLIQIHDPYFRKLDPWTTSMILAKAIEKLTPDLIFCGKEAVDDHNGQVGAYLAEWLGYPYISCVVGLELLPNKKAMRVSRALGRGDKEILECLIPALFSVEKGINEPRYPTLPNLLKAFEQKIECWDGGTLGLQMDEIQPMTEVVEILYPRPRVKRISSPDSHLNGFERVLNLLAGSKMEKKGRLLEGFPEQMAAEIVRFLRENGIIEE